MDNLVEIGIFATDASLSADRQRVLYRKKHRLRSGEQTLTVTVDEKPVRASARHTHLRGGVRERSTGHLPLLDRSSWVRTMTEQEMYALVVRSVH
jgi:hypothetical protein